MAVKSPIVVFILCLVGIGAAQQCVNITDLSIPTADINTTVPFCFECPGSLPSFTLNSVMISNAPPDVVINLNTNTLVISNWSAVLVRLDRSNSIECSGGPFGADISRGSFYSLIPEPLSLSGTTRVFYLEGTDVGVGCVNRNLRPGYTGTVVWRNSDGNEVGMQGLSLPAVSRGLAGTYTCSVPDLPIIPSVTFEVVVYYAPELSIASDPERLVNVGGTFKLDCSYVGFPQASVTWTLNGTVVDNSTDSDLTITTTESSSGRTSYLTWVNASPLTSRGRYYCIITNDAGSANETYNVEIATSPEPAANFSVTGTTSSTVSLSWDNQYDGLLPITGGRLDYFVMGSPNISETVSGTTATLSGLIPFAFYNITLFVVNSLGLSDPVSLVQQTDSNVLGAPSVTLTQVSSTQLNLTWTAPAESDLVSPATTWTWEFSLLDGTESQTNNLSATVLAESFPGLAKGTEYRARVVGTNIRGLGIYSDYETRETRVDPPSAPVSLTVVPLSSFAFNSTWQAPTDDGGRPVNRYNIQVNDPNGATVYSRTVDNVLYHFVNNKTVLQPSTIYNVSVAGVNTAGSGVTASVAVTTISLEQPQPLLVSPPVSGETNVSATVTWTFPGGNVTFFLVTLTERQSQFSINFTVNGTELQLIVVDLKPATTYDVVIETVNTLGTSTASPLTSFNTMDPPPPEITANPASGPYRAGTNVVLTCTTPDSNRPIEWSKRNSPSLPLKVSGEFLMSTLTITDIQEENSGMYLCTVGSTRTEFTVEVFTPTTAAPTSTPISSTTIIIAVAVAGGGALVILTIGVIVVVLCCCCRGGDIPKPRRSAGYSPKKKGKDFFEISNTFTPTTNTGITRESNVSFNMPEDFQAHSSFNTMEKQNKVDIERSHSPEVTQPTSFGANASRNSTDGLMNEYQMPPSDGTML